MVVEEEDVIEVRLSGSVLMAVDAWIARHDDPKPSRSKAIAELVAGRLGAHSPSTIMPDLVTGRDIV
jgi:hypothetical protein